MPAGAGATDEGDAGTCGPNSSTISDVVCAPRRRAWASCAETALGLATAARCDARLSRAAVYHSLMGATEDRGGGSGERLWFQHRSSDSRLIERAWSSWSLDTTVMTSVARAHWDFVFWEGPDGRRAGIQGPESRASEAPVPAQAEFVGVRLGLGVLLAHLPAAQLVDRFVALPVDGRWFHLGGERIAVPSYPQVEDFVALLVRKGLLVVADPPDERSTERTRQRHHLNAIGLSQRTVRQIARAQSAAVRLQSGEHPAAVAQDAGYFDQPHLARSLRRFIGPSATELADGDSTGRPLSLLYKTEAAVGR